MIIELSLGLAAGFALGWFMHAAKRSTKALVLEELFSRKLKLAESDREQALRTSDERKRELAGLEERLATQDAETERLLSELETSVAARLAAEAEFELQAEAFAAARDEALRARTFADEVLLESSQAARERDEMAAASETLRVQLAAREIEAEQLATRLRERGGEVDDLRGELTLLVTQLDELRAAQQATEREAADSRAAFESARAELMRLRPLEAALAEGQRVLAAREVEFAALASQMAEFEANSRASFEAARAELMRLRPLEAALAEGQRALATREAEIATLASEVAELEAKAEHLRATEAALAAAREESMRHATTIARLEHNLEHTTQRMRALTAEQRLRTVEIKPPPKSPKHAAVTRDAAASDDLQRIAGIGPVLAKKLHRVGVTTFRQLAGLSRDDVDRVARALGLPAARIRRERWIAAARDELRAKTV
jgi:predicted flap endonuclease-1-like 5' DNA nuclease